MEDEFCVDVYKWGQQIPNVNYVLTELEQI